MKSNLPPGVTDGMLPGNTQEDAAWDKFFDSLDFDDLSIEEAYMAVKIGIISVKAIRPEINSLIKEIRADERMAYEMEKNDQDTERADHLKYDDPGV